MKRTAWSYERSRECRRLLTEQSLTLDEIGAHFGISRERVRQILKADWGLVSRDVATRERTRSRRSKRYSANWFWSQVDTTAGQDGCWPWIGRRVNPVTGYATVPWGPDARSTYVHRVAYELSVGPIPDGFVIDHVWTRGCRSRLCVNGAHLEAVTPGENTRRSLAVRRAQKEAAR